MGGWQKHGQWTVRMTGSAVTVMGATRLKQLARIVRVHIFLAPEDVVG